MVKKKIHIFQSTIAIVLHAGLRNYKRKVFSPQKPPPALQNNTYLDFLLFLWVTFKLDPDPDMHDRYGTDPQHLLFVIQIHTIYIVFSWRFF
jgi:hypothetical protein